MTTAHNDITGDTLRSGKGSLDKYAHGWENIFKPNPKNVQPSDLKAVRARLKEGRAPKRDIFAELPEGFDTMAATYKPVALEASLCVACGESVIYLEELKHDPIHCPHCDNTFSVYHGGVSEMVPNEVTMSAIEESRMLFADMHSRKGDFSIERVGKAFADLRDKIAAALPDELPTVMCGPVEEPTTVMALDFHDGSRETICHRCDSIVAYNVADKWVKCRSCPAAWENTDAA